MATIKDILERNNAYSKDLEAELLRNLIDTSRNDSAAIRAKTIAVYQPQLAEARAALALAMPLIDVEYCQVAYKVPSGEVPEKWQRDVIAARDAVRQALGEDKNDA